MVSCTILVHNDVEAPGLKLNCKFLEHRLSLSLIKITTSKILHKILLRVIALKLSELDKFAHRPLGIDSMVPNNMPSGDNPCHSMMVNKIAR